MKIIAGFWLSVFGVLVLGNLLLDHGFVFAGGVLAFGLVVIFVHQTLGVSLSEGWGVPTCLDSSENEISGQSHRILRMKERMDKEL